MNVHRPQHHNGPQGATLLSATHGHPDPWVCPEKCRDCISRIVCWHSLFRKLLPDDVPVQIQPGQRVFTTAIDFLLCHSSCSDKALRDPCIWNPTTTRSFATSSSTYSCRCYMANSYEQGPITVPESSATYLWQSVRMLDLKCILAILARTQLRFRSSIWT